MVDRIVARIGSWGLRQCQLWVKGHGEEEHLYAGTLGFFELCGNYAADAAATLRKFASFLTRDSTTYTASQTISGVSSRGNF